MKPAVFCLLRSITLLIFGMMLDDLVIIQVRAANCGVDDPCPNNEFCNFDYETSGFCEDCPTNESSCLDMGLPINGVTDCKSVCATEPTKIVSQFNVYPVDTTIGDGGCDVPTNKANTMKSMGFTKVTCPYGILITGTANYPDNFLQLGANIIASILDQDSDGVVDDPDLVDILTYKGKAKGGAVLVCGVTQTEEQKGDSLSENNLFDYAFSCQTWKTDFNDLADVKGIMMEEAFHMIHQLGYAVLYPAELGMEDFTSSVIGRELSRLQCVSPGYYHPENNCPTDSPRPPNNPASTPLPGTCNNPSCDVAEFYKMVLFLAIGMGEANDPSGPSVWTSPYTPKKQGDVLSMLSTEFKNMISTPSLHQLSAPLTGEYVLVTSNSDDSDNDSDADNDNDNNNDNDSDNDNDNDNDNPLNGDCSINSPCPNEEFCNYDYKISGFCEDCPTNESSCLDMGLPINGVTDCKSVCSIIDDNEDNEDEEENEDEVEDLLFDGIPQPIGSCVSNRNDGAVPDDIWSTTAIIYDDKKYPPFKKYVMTRGIILAAISDDDITDIFLNKVTTTLNQMIPNNKNGQNINRSDQEQMMVAMARKRTLIPVFLPGYDDGLTNDEKNQLNTLQNDFSMCDVIFQDDANPRSQIMEVVEHLLHFINMVGLHYLQFNEWGIGRQSKLYNELKTSCSKGFFNYDGCESIGNNGDDTDRILLQEYGYWLIATWMDLVVPYGPSDVENEWKLFKPSLLMEQQSGAYSLCQDQLNELLAVPTNLEDYKFPGKPQQENNDPTPIPLLPPVPVLEPTWQPTSEPTDSSTGECDDRPNFVWINKKGEKKNCQWILTTNGKKNRRKRCMKRVKGGNIKGKKRFFFYCPATCARFDKGPCKDNKKVLL